MPFTKQKELEMQRRLLKRAEKLAGIGHWYVDLIENTLFWSDEIYRIHGLDKEKFVPTLKGAIDLYHPDDRQLVGDYLSEAVEEKLEFFFELRAMQPSGDIRLVQSYGEPEVDEEGVVTGIFGIYRDITDIRQKELENEEQKQFMELILETIPDPVFVKDTDYKILMANPAFMELYPENKRDKVIGYTTVEDYDQKQAEEFLKEDKKALENGYSEAYETIDFPNGEQRTFFTKKVRFENSEGDANILGMVRDITELTVKEKEISSAKHFLESIMEQIPDPIFVKDQNSIIVLANTAFKDLYPEDQRDNIIGKTTFEGYDPEQVKIFKEKDKLALAEGYSETYDTILFPSGESKTIFIKKVKLTDPFGTDFLLAIGRDVSEIQKTKAELERSNKDLQDFAFTVSHDLKAPLRHISMSASFLKDGIHEKLDETQQEFLKIMTDGAEKAQIMIDTLLEYSRIGRADMEFEEVDLNITINNVLSMLALEIEEQTADIVVKKMPIITGNDGLLMRLFQNLVENALKYQKPGTIPKIKIYAEESKDQVEIHIEDNGIGIDPQFAEKIFVIFQRLHGEESEYYGLGLGLAVCQKIARAHNGNIHLDTDYTDGAGFILTIPLK